MKHLFLNKELSQLAKEKGFDEPCIGFHYVHNDTIKFLPSFDNKQDGMMYSVIFNYGKKIDKYINLIPAPLYQQIIDWFREKYNIHINIYPSFDNANDIKEITGYSAHLWWEFKGENVKSREIPLNYSGKCDEEVPPTYYSALDKAIEEAFKLI